MTTPNAPSDGVERFRWVDLSAYEQDRRNGEYVSAYDHDRVVTALRLRVAELERELGK